MPQALAFALFTWGAPLFLVNGVLGIGLAGSIFSAIGSAALGLAASYGAQLLLNKPAVPAAQDGKYNLKQNVPPLVRVYGRVKKGGDYAFLEERDGVAYHIVVMAAHRIEGYVEHWLHDDLITLDGSGNVTVPEHYNPFVVLSTQLGYDASTAFFVGVFPDIWTADHRGDGLASVAMVCASPAAEDLQTVYPSAMPLHTAVFDGALIYDPRSETTAFSSNLALIRADHLRHPSGGAKLGFDDLYWPDWENAADVCDQSVTDRAGSSRPRYHGGLWYRYNNDQVEVGRLIDQAAELVIYERADGKIGVHAGEYVAPDIRLTIDDILSCSFDANRRRGSNVLAVRGRYTEPEQNFNQIDAAIYGNPYVSDDTERSRTVDNQAVQWHNHMARLQKLAYIRANAPRVKIIASYEAARNVPYRRFVKIHKPPQLVEAIVEIQGRPKLSLANLTYEFEGIVVPATLFDFIAASEEGEPGSVGVPVEHAGVPVPAAFAVEILTRDIGGGVLAPYAKGTWTHVSNSLTYQLVWQPTAGGAEGSNNSKAGDDEVETAYLTDGVEFRFRLRAWAPGGRPSSWTSYITATVTADPTAPPIPLSVSADDGVGSALLHWTTPNSTHFAATRIYRNTANDFSTATLIEAIYSGPSLGRTYEDTASADTYYYWLTSANFSGVESAEVATGATIIS